MLEEIIKRTRSSIIIIGHSGAGKTTLANLISLYSGAHIIEVGHHVISEASQQPQPMSALEYADAKLRAGKYYHFVEQIAASHDFSEPTIIVGPRQVQEVKFFRDVLNSTIVIGLDAPDDVRETRRCDPEELGTGGPTWLEHRDKVERAWGAENTLQLADAVLDATKPPSHLLAQAAHVWKEMGKPVTSRSRSYFFLQDIMTILKKDESYSPRRILDTSPLIIEA